MVPFAASHGEQAADRRDADTSSVPEHATIRIIARDARRLAITGQRLSGPLSRPTRAGIMRVIRDIGYLQLDPTSVVARNPYLVLWSRLGNYDRALVDDLLAKHRDVYETPSLILPTSDLPMHAALMQQYRKITAARGWGPRGTGKWSEVVGRWFNRNQALRRSIVARLRREGPLPLTAFEDRAVVSWTSGGWNNDRNVTMMLAVLQRRGEVVVAGRRRGQKLWAVAEGHLPTVTPLPTPERERQATRLALRAMGLATLKNLRWYYAFNRHITPDAVKRLEREGELVAVEVEDVPGVFYATPDITRRVRALVGDWEPRTTLLSPFDNLIMDRARLLDLFGMYYRIEIYTPVHLRKRGYWAMPLVLGDRIVASVDPRVDRERDALVVNRVVLEKDAPRNTMTAAKRAAEELAEFVGMKEVRWPRARS